MQPVDYDVVAPTYDQRYARRRYETTLDLLGRFIGDERVDVVVEIGCGTGHWLRELDDRAALSIGLDRSSGMLERARITAPATCLVRGDAASLPWPPESIDRVFSVNALHHFRDPAAFMRECSRVLKPGGGFLSIGLDPHTDTDQWWVYEYFPTTRVADRARYLSTERIRALLAAAGFLAATTEPADHLTSDVPYAEACARGSVDRRATSQLMVISDEEFAQGLRRLEIDQPVLHTNLRLFSTTAWTSPGR